jgi:hypothetical protein
VGHLRSQKDVDKKYVYQILLDIIKLFKKLPTILDIPVPQVNAGRKNNQNSDYMIGRICPGRRLKI